MKTIVQTYVILCFVSTIYSSGILKCPRHGVMENFNISRFTGRWYEVERAFYFMELVIKCLTIDVNQNKRGQIEISARTISRWSGNQKISEGIATPTRRDPSILNYKIASYLPQSVSKLLPGVATYQIMDTDYDNYAIIWSCIYYGLFHSDRIWIWGRRREINATTRAQIYSFLADKGISSERLVLPNSNNCTDS